MYIDSKGDNVRLTYAKMVHVEIYEIEKHFIVE